MNRIWKTASWRLARSANPFGGFLLLSVVFLAAFLGILIAAAVMHKSIVLRGADTRVLSQKAFYAAESGVERALFMLRQNAAWRPGRDGEPLIEEEPVQARLEDGSLKTVGYYSLVVWDADKYKGWDSVWVRSIGRDDEKRTIRIITARLTLESPTAFLVSTMGDLIITSGAVIEDDILGRDIIFERTVEDKKIVVNGRIHYMRQLVNKDLADIKQNPVKVPPLTFAGVDLDRYRAISMSEEKMGTGLYHKGSVTVDLDRIDESVQIIYAEGDITIKGRYDHSLIVISGGNIKIGGDVVPALTEPDKSAPQIGLLAKKDIVIPKTAPKDLTLEAFIMADGGEDSRGGRFYAEGKFDSKGRLLFKGSMALRGDSEKSAVDLNAYSQRLYEFNEQLNTNRTIPFLPFIANIIPGTWMESYEAQAPPTP